MTSDINENEPATKRRRATSGRRKAACQTCSLRKVKCDNARPECLSCQTTGSRCVYVADPGDALTLNKVVEIITGQINGLAEKLDSLVPVTYAQPSNSNSSPGHLSITSAHHTADSVNIPLSETAQHREPPEPSRDFSHIPAHKTTADEILTWPIFDNAFPQNYLIDAHLGYRLSTGGIFDEHETGSDSILPTSSSTAPLDEHRIPGLVDRFLENVHTKNPILDVETLVRKSREHASRGLGWDGYSCLLLLASALGLVAKPFGAEMEAMGCGRPVNQARQIVAPARDKDQADNCFVQASRRLGALRPSILTSQCYFFAGVYLMYTLRPMLSWQYFHQASVVYLLYLKMHGRITDDNIVLMQKPLQSTAERSKTNQLEQRLYWSCFKSEAEFRVELPLPQTEIASYEFPNLFPSPPSPLTAESPETTTMQASSNLSISHVLLPGQEDEVKLHAKRLCNEEESWYYYLTEVALRRIGNRVINTFFRQDRHEWMNIERFLDVAIEFEAQVSTWQTNLPPAMQTWETNSMIRAPRIVSPGGAEAGFVSQELSWATENRLLEMRSWLYQPFLYYLVHARPTPPSPVQWRHDSFAQSLGSPSSIIGDGQNVFWTFIARAIDCNLTILETRSIPHRHHGLWFDLRAITCSSLILLAVVKSGYSALITGGHQTLIGEIHEQSNSPVDLRLPNAEGTAVGTQPRTEGKLARVLRQLEIWSHESPDMVRAREVLNMLIHQIVEVG